MKKILFTITMILFAYQGFSLNIMYAPTLITPTNNAVNQMPNAFLKWTAVPGGFLYKVQVSEDSLFVTSNNYSSNLTALNAYNLHFNTKYFWRVKAIGATDSSAWSSYGIFYTINTVTITRPFDSSMNRSVSAYFRWNGIAGIPSYEYQMDSSMSFTSPLFVSGIISGAKTEAYSKQLAFGTHYFLRMRALHADDTSTWSSLTTFSTLTDLSSRKPQNDTIRQLPVTKLEWNWAGSLHYEYEISTDSLFTSSLTYTVDTNKVIKQSSPPDTLVRVYTDTLYFGQKYFWKVRAKNAYGTSNWSQVKKFTTIDKLNLLLPANNSNNVSVLPVFKWDSIKNIGYYIFELDKTPTFSNPETLLLPKTSGTYSMTSNPLLYNKDYYWRIRAITLLDSCDWSDTFTFKTTTPAGVENNILDNNSVSIYPNPTLSGKVHVQIESNENQPLNISVINMIGQSIFDREFTIQSGNNIFTIDLSNKEKGIYFLKLQNEFNTVTRKIILNK